MKQYVIIAAAVYVLFSLSSCSEKMKENLSINSDHSAATHVQLDKGSYSSNEYIAFKKENFRSDMYTEQNFSEKVKFKAFVKHKQQSAE